MGYCPDLFPWGGVCHGSTEEEAYRQLCALVAALDSRSSRRLFPSHRTQSTRLQADRSPPQASSLPPPLPPDPGECSKAEVRSPQPGSCNGSGMIVVKYEIRWACAKQTPPPLHGQAQPYAPPHPSPLERVASVGRVSGVPKLNLNRQCFPIPRDRRHPRRPPAALKPSSPSEPESNAALEKKQTGMPALLRF